MPLIHVAVLAALSGVTEALAVSSSGHAAVAKLWIEPGASPAQAEAVMTLGAAVGLVAATWRRLAGAIGEGVRAVARPSIFGASLAAHDARTLLVGVAASLAVSAFTLPRVETWAGSPTAAGLGLFATGLALASTLLIPRFAAHGREGRTGPSLAGAALVGAAHGLAVFPGASRVGAALTVLLWIGVLPLRAIDLAFLITAPSLVVAFAHRARGGLPAGTIAIAFALAFFGALVASEILRSLAPRRRIGTLALWLLPLGLAMLAYARALSRAV